MKIFKHCISHIYDGKISISYKKNNPFSLKFDQVLSEIQLITLYVIVLPDLYNWTRYRQNNEMNSNAKRKKNTDFFNKIHV